MSRPKLVQSKAKEIMHHEIEQTKTKFANRISIRYPKTTQNKLS